MGFGRERKGLSRIGRGAQAASRYSMRLLHRAARPVALAAPRLPEARAARSQSSPRLLVLLAMVNKLIWISQITCVQFFSNVYHFYLLT